MLKPCEAVVRAANLCREAVHLKLNVCLKTGNTSLDQIFIFEEIRSHWDRPKFHLHAVDQCNISR